MVFFAKNYKPTRYWLSDELSWADIEADERIQAIMEANGCSVQEAWAKWIEAVNSQWNHWCKGLE